MAFKSDIIPLATRPSGITSINIITDKYLTHDSRSCSIHVKVNNITRNVIFIISFFIYICHSFVIIIFIVLISIVIFPTFIIVVFPILFF